MQHFTIAGHDFIALDLWDATFAAIARAKELYRSAGDSDAQRATANALFAEAVGLRQIERAMLPVHTLRRTRRPRHAGRRSA